MSRRFFSTISFFKRQPRTGTLVEETGKIYNNPLCHIESADFLKSSNLGCFFMMTTDSATLLHFSGITFLYLPGEPKSGGHVTVTHYMLASTFRAFHTRRLHRSEKKRGNICKTFLTYFHVSRYSIFFCLASSRNKLLFCRLTLRWEEMNQIG